MAVEVTCKCGKLLSLLDEFAGKRVQCPNCRKWSKLPKTSNRKTEQPVESARERRKSETKEARSALQQSNVATGLAWVYYGTALMVLVGVLQVCAALAPQRNVSPDDLSATSVLNLMAFVAGVLTIVGKFQCLSAPNQMPGRGRMSQAVFIDVLAMSLCVFGKSATLPPEFVMALLAAMILLPIWGFASFVMFLRHLGEFLQRHDITEKATGVLHFVRMLLVGVLVWLLLFFTQIPPLILMGLIGLLIYAVVGTFRYLDLLSACQDELAKE